jgi:DNA-directed RNA polymerase subunit RPC12/RpoP
MSTVVIRCATCRTEINTRINVDSTTFNKLPEKEDHMVCPRCGARDFWNKSRARLVENGDENPAT